MKLPLFPLNTVLFPGMMLPLHIFEPRYREMVGLCIEHRQPFGVVLIQSGSEVGSPASPHSVGTYGRIADVQRLPDGRLNIEMVGQERFRILELHYDKAYLQGTIQPYPLSDVDHANARALAGKLRPLVRRYLQLLSESAEVDLHTQQLPAEPGSLAYLAAIVAQIPMEEKQTLLTCPSALDLLGQEHTLFRREVSLIRALLNNPLRNTSPDFCPN